MAIRVLAQPAEKGLTIGTAIGWGAALGGIQRVSPVASTVMSVIGLVGGMIAAMAAKEPITANIAEGLATGSAAIYGLSLTAPVVGRGVAGAKAKAKTGADRLLLKGSEAAQVVRTGAVAQVGAGLE